MILAAKGVEPALHLATETTPAPQTMRGLRRFAGELEATETGEPSESGLAGSLAVGIGT